MRFVVGFRNAFCQAAVAFVSSGLTKPIVVNVTLRPIPYAQSWRLQRIFGTQHQIILFQQVKFAGEIVIRIFIADT